MNLAARPDATDFGVVALKRFATFAAAALALATSAASAKVSPQVHYSSAKTPLGTLLADPAARAAVAKRFPLLIQSRPVMSGMANRMTLRSLKRFKPKVFTDTSLAAIDADFAQMHAR